MNNVSVKVSVIIPTYRRQKEYLIRAINSVLGQTYDNIEVIVVDDNHADSEYRNIVQSVMTLFEDNSSVIYIKNAKNMGGELARNEGINASSGDFITFLDDDDKYLPDKVSNQVHFMLEKQCDMCFTNLKIFNENDVIVDYREHKELNDFSKEALLKYHLMKHLTGTPTFMYRADKLKQIGGFDDVPVGQEFYLMIKSIEQDLHIDYLKTCDVIAYRHGDGGISFGQKKINGEKKLFEFKKKYFDKLSLRERMYVRFRHQAVLTVSHLRNKHYILAAVSSVKALLISPYDFFYEVLNFTKKVSEQRGT